MSRTRIVSLVLVNWRGVFYERYLLDPNVTALEGSNGAGKTTVMIAAYVALLPDMSRLRFTNLGESGGATGDRGIWGRLGEASRPSYTLLELCLGDGSRVIAGVRLLKKTEPVVEPTPFLIENIPDEVTLQELMLVVEGEDEHVPQLAQLRENIKSHKGSFTVFRSVKEYFAALFDRGVTPLRLVGEEDRNKFNDMLRTSMTGGISKTLTTELRTFVLKKESGLADTLSRMRGNLDACRRSRSEVIDARRLQREISGVYDAGTAFFSRLVLAAREEAEEHREALRGVKENLVKVERGHVDLSSAVAGHQSRQEQVKSRQEAARLSLQHAKETQERQKRALVLLEELAVRDEELAELSQAASQLQLAMQACEEDRAAQQGRRKAAEDAYDRSAGGLAKLQDGLDELHRRARDYRQVHQNIELAKTLLNRESLRPEMCGLALSETLAACEAIDSERARLQRDTQALSLRRSEFRDALDALAYIESKLPEESRGDKSPHKRARQALAELERRFARLGGLPEMQQERSDLEVFVQRQVALWDRAQKLGLEVGKTGCSDALAARLEMAETTWAKEDDAARHHQNVGADREREHANLLAEGAALELRSARYAKAASAALRLSEYTGNEAPKASSELTILDRGLAKEHTLLVAKRVGWSKEREEVFKLALDLESGGGAISSELMRIRDELSGELVAGRFEELAVEEAARLEAQLGPLAHAIIVDDLAASAEKIAELEGSIGETIWLVEAGTPLESLSSAMDGEGGGDCVVVQEQVGLRVSPVPNHPTLGRSAREKAAKRARKSALDLTEELELSLRELHRLESLRRDTAYLSEAIDVYAAGSPAQAQEQQAQRSETLLAEIEEHRLQASNARERAAGLREEVEGLRRILGESFFLDPPNYRAQAEVLDAEIEGIKSAEEELLSLGESRTILSELIDVLRERPPSEQDAEVSQQKILLLEKERDRQWKAKEALEEVLANRHALDWEDATRLLEERTHLVPALEEQHQAVRAGMQQASEALAQAELSWTAATKSWQAADARMVASQMMRERLALEVTELNPASSDSTTTENLVSAAERRLIALDNELLEVVESGARDRERLLRSEGHLRAAQAAVKNENMVCEPICEAWDTLRTRCEEAGLLASVLTATTTAEQRRSSQQLRTEAQGKRDLLLDRLSSASGGEELHEKISAQLHSGVMESVDTWLALRDWMRRRVPAQIADEEDPLIALDRLREHLAVLESRLGHQETDLRGSSEDVARGIDVQLRRARWQIHRLNQHLEDISFGNIRGIRVQMSRVERMEQILRALRDGEAQELLFQASLPFEDALNEIFSRYGGGRTGGQRLLDYREYLHLGVEIRRQSSEEWEEASPTKLSTGEAIGVGAALMMVILTEWERDANLLRSQKQGGSLRFLFLDEANRLSKDNLGVLFELCRGLELQLLIAAPEVAHAGDNTTYRLVRRALEGGGEEVLVTGRRAVSSADSQEAKDG